MPGEGRVRPLLWVLPFDKNKSSSGNPYQLFVVDPPVTNPNRALFGHPVQKLILLNRLKILKVNFSYNAPPHSLWVRKFAQS